MPYQIMQFRKPKKHRAGYSNRDIRRIGKPYPNITEALNALARIMDKNRFQTYLRLDKDVRYNAVAYADLDESGGVIRFRQRDNFHFGHQITLNEFKARLARRKD